MQPGDPAEHTSSTFFRSSRATRKTAAVTLAEELSFTRVAERHKSRSRPRASWAWVNGSSALGVII